MCCPPATDPAPLFLAYCPACESFPRPALLPLAEAGQAAGEHDHDRHHGEPTATVHRATEGDTHR